MKRLWAFPSRCIIIISLGEWQRRIANTKVHFGVRLMNGWIEDFLQAQSTINRDLRDSRKEDINSISNDNLSNSKAFGNSGTQIAPRVFFLHFSYTNKDPPPPLFSDTFRIETKTLPPPPFFSYTFRIETKASPPPLFFFLHFSYRNQDPHPLLSCEVIFKNPFSFFGYCSPPVNHHTLYHFLCIPGLILHIKAV